MTTRIQAALAIAAVLFLAITFAAIHPSAATPGCPPSHGNAINGQAYFFGSACPNCVNRCVECHGDPGAPCDPQLYDTCHYFCPHPEDPTKKVNMALYGAAKFALESFADGSMPMGPLSQQETLQMFKDLGITSSNGTPNEHALNDLAAYLAHADPRRYDLKGFLIEAGPLAPLLDVEVCSEYLPSANATAFGLSQIDPNTISYIVPNLLPGEYTVAPKPNGFDPPVRNVFFTFQASTIPGLACSTEIQPVNFSATGDVYCDATNGDDANSGRSWRTSKKSARAAMDAARAGEEIWVAAGKYVESITMKPGVALYGGFAGGESFREERRPEVNRAILDGNQKGSVVTILAGGGSDTRIDGFTIQHGNSSSVGGGIQIVCGDRASPIVANNVITDNRAAFAGGGIGVACAGRGLASPTITGNRITDNRADSRGGAIYVGDGVATMLNNMITNNRADAGGGVYAVNGLIANNAILENRSGADGGGGIYGVGAVQIINNTLVDNRALAGGGGAIELADSSALVVSNIIAFGSSGLRASHASPTLRNNCVFGNRDFDYSGVRPGSGDINADPQLAEPVRLRRTSPCIDAGDDGAVRAGWTDINGDPRILSVHVDIGADEAHIAAMSSRR